jgi:hypothetical protein
VVVVGWLGTATVTTQDLAGCHDTTKSGDFLLATTGDRYLATSGDFFMATDTITRSSWSWCQGGSAAKYGSWWERCSSALLWRRPYVARLMSLCV